MASATDAPSGTYSFSATVNSGSELVTASASYVVGPPPVSTGIPLVPDGDGHFDGNNPAGIVGLWWATGDDYGMDNLPGSGTCPADGFPDVDCSGLTTPTPGTFFRPDPGGRGMCTSGVSAQILPDGTGSLAYSSIWGDLIGFNLADPGTPADSGRLRGPYDALAHGITGFAFDIDTPPEGGHMRVQFQTVGTEHAPAYWQGATADVSPITGPGHYEIRWPAVGGPLYLSNPPPFDPTELDAIAFLVESNSAAPVPFSFCLNRLMLLTN